jgi:hypothetical protein
MAAMKTTPMAITPGMNTSEAIRTRWLTAATVDSKSAWYASQMATSKVSETGLPDRIDCSR